MSDQTEAVVTRHWEAFCKGDVPALLADYAEDAVLINEMMGVLRGKTAIGAMLTSVFKDVFPPDKTRFTMELHLCGGDISYLKYAADAPTLYTRGACDTFVVQNGKIIGQTATGEFLPK